MSPEDTYPMPAHGWTCFHCGETFTTHGSALDHFGPTPEAEAGCLIDRVALEEGGKPEHGRGLLIALRKAEAKIENLRQTTEQLDHEAGAYHAMSAELERYFGKGATTAHGAWLRYEEMESRVLVEQEKLATLTAELDALQQELTECRRGRIGDAEIIGREMCRAEAAEAQLAALTAEDVKLPKK